MALAAAVCGGIALGFSPLLYFGSRPAMAAWMADQPAFGEFVQARLTVDAGRDVAATAHVWNGSGGVGGEE